MLVLSPTRIKKREERKTWSEWANALRFENISFSHFSGYSLTRCVDSFPFFMFQAAAASVDEKQSLLKLDFSSACICVELHCKLNMKYKIPMCDLASTTKNKEIRWANRTSVFKSIHAKIDLETSTSDGWWWELSQSRYFALVDFLHNFDCYVVRAADGGYDDESLAYECHYLEWRSKYWNKNEI